MNDDELAHYGKIGMKWGRRSASKGSSTKSSSAKNLIAKLGTKKLKADNAKLKVANKKLKVANKSLDPKTTSTDKPEGKSRISDADLKSRINRLQMEKTYATLTAKQTSPGKKMVVDILSTAFKTTAQAYATKMMGKGLENFMTSKGTPIPNPVAAATSSAHTPNASNFVYPNFRTLN